MMFQEVDIGSKALRDLARLQLPNSLVSLYRWFIRACERREEDSDLLSVLDVLRKNSKHPAFVTDAATMMCAIYQQRFSHESRFRLHEITALNQTLPLALGSPAHLSTVSPWSPHWLTLNARLNTDEIRDETFSGAVAVVVKAVRSMPEASRNHPRVIETFSASMSEALWELLSDGNWPAIISIVDSITKAAPLPEDLPLSGQARIEMHVFRAISAYMLVGSDRDSWNYKAAQRWTESLVLIAKEHTLSRLLIPRLNAIFGELKRFSHKFEITHSNEFHAKELEGDFDIDLSPVEQVGDYLGMGQAIRSCESFLRNQLQRNIQP